MQFIQKEEEKNCKDQVRYFVEEKEKNRCSQLDVECWRFFSLYLQESKKKKARKKVQSKNFG